MRTLTINADTGEEVETPSPRDMLMKRKLKARVVITDAIKAEIVERVTNGELYADLERDEHMPRFSAVQNERANDPQFDAAMESALSACHDANIADAEVWARENATHGTVDDVRMADIYLKSIAAAAEKLAPKSHGVLVKHAGADGGAITVQLTKYGDAK